MKKINEKLPNRYVPYYLIDVAKGEYEELNLTNMRKRLDRSDNFIYDHCKSQEMFVVNDRAYILTDNFGKVWDLL